jgi:hypothetical protein
MIFFVCQFGINKSHAVIDGIRLAFRTSSGIRCAMPYRKGVKIFSVNPFCILALSSIANAFTKFPQNNCVQFVFNIWSFLKTLRKPEHVRNFQAYFVRPFLVNIAKVELAKLKKI